MALKTHSDSFGLNWVDSAQRGDSPTQFAMLGGPPSRVNCTSFQITRRVCDSLGQWFSIFPRPIFRMSWIVHLVGPIWGLSWKWKVGNKVSSTKAQIPWVGWLRMAKMHSCCLCFWPKTTANISPPQPLLAVSVLLSSHVTITSKASMASKENQKDIERNKVKKDRDRQTHHHSSRPDLVGYFIPIFNKMHITHSKKVCFDFYRMGLMFKCPFTAHPPYTKYSTIPNEPSWFSEISSGALLSQTCETTYKQQVMEVGNVTFI